MPIITRDPEQLAEIAIRESARLGGVRQRIPNAADVRAELRRRAVVENGADYSGATVGARPWIVTVQ
jgi:hypothetical protein